jgi:hypothetical protein
LPASHNQASVSSIWNGHSIDMLDDTQAMAFKDIGC